MRTIVLTTKPTSSTKAWKRRSRDLVKQASPLKLGYAAVRCRNQRENEAQISMTTARERGEGLLRRSFFLGF